MVVYDAAAHTLHWEAEISDHRASAGKGVAQCSSGDQGARLVGRELAGLGSTSYLRAVSRHKVRVDAMADCTTFLATIKSLVTIRDIVSLR